MTILESFVQKVAGLIESKTGLTVERNSLDEGLSREDRPRITLRKLNAWPSVKTGFVGDPIWIKFKIRLVARDKTKIAETVSEPLALDIIDFLTPENLGYACSMMTFDDMDYIQDGDGDDLSVVPIELTFSAMLPKT